MLHEEPILAGSQRGRNVTLAVEKLVVMSVGVTWKGCEGDAIPWMNLTYQKVVM